MKVDYLDFGLEPELYEAVRKLAAYSLVSVDDVANGFIRDRINFIEASKVVCTEDKKYCTYCKEYFIGFYCSCEAQ